MSESTILKMAARIILPIGLLFSVHILLRGHHLPGGGFIAGLTTSSVLAIQYLAFGWKGVQERLRISYLYCLCLGLALALGTGVFSLLVGFPFLTGKIVHLHSDLLGDVELASAVIFDVGVFLTVVGVTTGIFEALGKEKPWKPYS